MDWTVRNRRALIPDTGTGWLKVIALIFMFADHSGKMLFGNMTEMRILGRIAFPLYAWCLVVGFHYTRSVPKYLLRLALVGILSQPLYVAAMGHTWTEPNILFTLVIALAALWGMELKKYGSHIWAPILALLSTVVLGTDYGWRGVLLVMLLYAAQGDRGALAAVMAAFCLFWGSTSADIQNAFGGALKWMTEIQELRVLTQPMLRMQFAAILALPLMLLPIPRERDLKLPHWLAYALYPGHLVLLYALELLMKH